MREKKRRDDTSTCPLCLDIELRPRGTEPATLGRMLEPHGSQFVEDLMKSLNQLRRLAEEAHERGDLVAEIRLLDQSTALCIRVLRLTCV